MKNLKFYIPILLLISLCVYLFIKCNSAETDLKKFVKKDQSVKKQIQTEAKEVARKVDEKGIEAVVFDVTENRVSPKDLQSNASIKGIIDTTALALDIRTKQLKQVLVVNSSLSAENLQLKRQLGNAALGERPYYTYNQNGLNLKFTPPVAGDTASVATADFSANVQIKATQYWKRNWFLGSKKSYLQVTSNSPLYKINNAEYVEFEQKQPFFGLRIQAAGNINPQTGSYGFGPAARFDIGRFSVQGNYTYYPESTRWRPSVNVNYDILRF